MRRAGAGVLLPCILLAIRAANAASPMASEAPMQMGDAQRFGKVLIDQLEWRRTDSRDAAGWEAEAWYGGDRDKLWARTEGERSGASTRNAMGELFWDRALGAWWNLQAGVREDFGGGPPRTWAALGVEGLAPYWLNVEATVYVGEAGRTAARLKAEYDLLLTQRLVLQPEAEASAYAKRDPARRLGAGISDLEVGLRLRYEIRRELAPYVGVAWIREADLVPFSGAARSVVSSRAEWVAGLRTWF